MEDFGPVATVMVATSRKPKKPGERFGFIALVKPKKPKTRKGKKK